MARTVPDGDAELHHALDRAPARDLVEGLTEFLPISSTGHLIVVSALVDFEGKRAEVFQIFIQLGAILSVVWEYRARLLTRGASICRRSAAEVARFVVNLHWPSCPPR